MQTASTAARTAIETEIELTAEEILSDLTYPHGNGSGAPVRGRSADGAVGSAERHAELDPAATRRRTITWQDPRASLARVAHLPGIEQLRRVASGDVPPPPIGVVMRMRPVELEHGRAVFEGEPGEEHYNPIGAVHGGYAATILDSVLGCALQTTLPAGTVYTTQSLEVKFVRPISAETGTVRASAEVVHAGRRQATAGAELRSAETGKLLAHATATLMILGRD